MAHRRVRRKFDQICVRCHAVIPKGSLFWNVDGYARHSSCGKHTAGTQYDFSAIAKARKELRNRGSGGSGGSHTEQARERVESKKAEIARLEAAMPQEVVREGRILRMRFDSISECVAWSNAPCYNPENEVLRSVLDGNGTTWRNGYTRSKLIDALREPPKAVTEMVRRFKADLEARHDAEIGLSRSRIRRLEYGDDISSERYMYRQLDCWEEMRRDAESVPLTRIAVNLTAIANEKAPTVAYRGAVAAAIIDLLNDRGHNVEVDGLCLCSGWDCNGNTAYCRVTIKSGQMPLDIDSVAFAIGEVAFFRLGMLTAMDAVSPHRTTHGHGHVLSKVPNDLADDYDVVVGREVYDEASAVRFLLAWLAKHGGIESD